MLTTEKKKNYFNPFKPQEISFCFILNIVSYHLLPRKKIYK